MSKDPYYQPKPPLGVGLYANLGYQRTKKIRMSTARYRELLGKVRDMYPKAPGLAGYMLGLNYNIDIDNTNPVRYFVCGDAMIDNPIADNQEGVLTVSMVEDNNVYPIVLKFDDNPAASTWNQNIFITTSTQCAAILPIASGAFDYMFSGKWAIIQKFENNAWFYTNEFDQRIVLVDVVNALSADLFRDAS